MLTILFEYEEDRKFFTELICADGESIDKYFELFDFRDPNRKRKEFNNNRNDLLNQLISLYSRKCFLGIEGLCDLNSGIAVDHLIPLSSNILNKKIRSLASEAGKKVKTQSFGSNNEKNLIVACSNCNNFKKHRFLDRHQLQAVLKLKYANKL